MIKPINEYILIEPVAHESFTISQSVTYDEIGIVIDVSFIKDVVIRIGDKVYFDSWMAAKFPKDVSGEFYWLVPFANIKAYERQVSEKQL